MSTFPTTLWFIRSTDGGETWSQRLRLNDDDGERDPGYDQMFPGVSVAPNGRIDVAWQDFRTDALYNPDGSGETDRSNQTCWDIFSTFSTDGGATWAPNVRVSDRSMNQFEGYAMNLSYDLRGPTAVTSTDAETHVAWSDSRGGRFELPAEDVYVASVLHEPSPSDRFSPQWASGHWVVPPDSSSRGWCCWACRCRCGQGGLPRLKGEVRALRAERSRGRPCRPRAAIP